MQAAIVIAFIPSGPELVVLLLIVFITISMGKLPAVGRVIAGWRKGLMEETPRPPLDITPGPEAGVEGATARQPGPKPGTARQPVEDAEIDDREATGDVKP